MFKRYVLMDKAGDPPAGGDKGGEKGDQSKQLEELRSMNTKLLDRLDALEKKSAPPPKDDKDDPSLADKARQKREDDDKKAKHEKTLESAIRFTTTAKEWIKTNATLLPKTIEDIFAAAEKENYASAIEKVAAIHEGIVSEFFAVQANMDLLTASQKTVLEDFKKLTKTDRQARAQQIFDTIFEPTFESLKKIKRAEQVRNGLEPEGDVSEAYKKRLIEGSRKHHLGEKSNA